MAQNALIQIRVDDALKKDADALFSALGLDTPTAIRIFLKQALMQNGLPFTVTQPTPNADTIAAMKESERIARDPDVKGYEDVDQMMKELLA